MKIRLEPYVFEETVEQASGPWRDGDDPEIRRRRLAEVFDRLAAGVDGTAAQPGVAAVLGTDLHAARRGYAEAELSSVPPEMADLCLGFGSIAETARITAGMAVLDVGCGGGLDAVLAALAAGPGGGVTGLDVSGGMIERARRIAEQACPELPLTFLQGCAEQLPFEDGTFDRVLMNFTLSLVPDRPAALREATRVLRADGILAIHDVFTEGLPRDIEDALSGWGSGVGPAPGRSVLLRELVAAGLETGREETRVFDRKELQQMALATLEDPLDTASRRVLDGFIQRLAGRVGVQVLTLTRAPSPATRC